MPALAREQPLPRLRLASRHGRNGLVPAREAKRKPAPPGVEQRVKTMKYLKMLGLAAIAAMALMAIGAGTASATKLCEENKQTGCITHVLKGSLLPFTSESTTTWTNAFGGVVAECKHSLVEGPTTTTGSSTETVKVNISKLQFTECNHPVTTTNTDTTTILGSLEVHAIAGTKVGTVKSTGTTVTIDESPFGTCHFLTNLTDIGTLIGKDDPNSKTPGTPTLLVKASIPSENCGFNGTWEGSYKYTGATPFNVSES
jgi:hypothetical protein